MKEGDGAKSRLSTEKSDLNISLLCMIWKQSVEYFKLLLGAAQIP